jgi:hypothetical protein
MPIAWAIAAVVVGLIGAGAVGFAGYGSESAGVSAAYLAAGPLGFVCSGAAGAAIIHLAVKSGGARIYGPFGCGCFGAIALAAGVWVFFTAIFPSL